MPTKRKTRNPQTDYSHLRTLLFNEPLMVTGAALDAVLHAVEGRFGLDLGSVDLAGDEADLVAPAMTRMAGAHSSDVLTVIGTTAIVPVQGKLTPRGNIHPESGMQSYEGIRALLTVALKDPAVDSIYLDIDSPGGSAQGAFELAEFIGTAQRTKPITAIVNMQATSAGYLLASACTEIYAPASAAVGSIGVIVAHADMRKAAADKGAEVTVFRAGARKALPNPLEALDDTSRKEITERIESMYLKFATFVAEHRGIELSVVLATESRAFSGAEGLTSGFIDGISTAEDAFSNHPSVLRNLTANRTAYLAEPKEHVGMNAEILELLGLTASGDATADTQASVAAITALKADKTAGAEFLAGMEVASFDLARAKITGLVPAADLQTAQDTIRRTAAETAVASLMAAESGKIAAVNQEWATAFHMRDPEGFAAHFAAAPRVIPAGASIVPAPGAATDEKGACWKRAGMSEAEYNGLVADFGKEKADAQCLELAEGSKPNTNANA